MCSYTSIKKINKKEVKTENTKEDEDIQIDKDNLEIYFDVVDDNDIKDNTWYEVEGILKKTDYNGIDIMYIKIINIKEIDSSKEEQYVYPCYSYNDGTCKEFLKYHLDY